MARLQNTSTAERQSNSKPHRKWWVIISVTVLMMFGCEKDILNTDSDQKFSGGNVREETRNDDAYRIQNAVSFDELVLQSNEVDDGITKCIILPMLPDWATRYFVMNQAEIEADRLIINVSYTGGSRIHDFKLVSTTFQESMPVQVTAQVFHFSNDDHYDRWITEVREFDLRPLKELYSQMYHRSRGKIIINLIDIFDSQEAAPLIYEFFDDAILPPEPPLPPIVREESW